MCRWGAQMAREGPKLRLGAEAGGSLRQGSEAEAGGAPGAAVVAQASCATPVTHDWVGAGGPGKPHQMHCSHKGRASPLQLNALLRHLTADALAGDVLRARGMGRLSMELRISWQPAP